MITMKVLLLPLSVLFCCCNQPNGNSKALKRTFNQHMIDSVIKNGDSSYAKPYKRTDFVNVYFYINKKDSSICQLMKDSSGTIRQMIIARKNIRTFFAQYYENGQLQADLPLDEFGQYHGTATYYYADGHIQSNGKYRHGLKKGIWTNYNEKGNLLSKAEYDSIGQLMKTTGNN